ncbi:hypothetical protein C4J81_10350 [Deltaproteobacteria bacterium Smac51]|nr:hypothetical protein C4J81_10350 [Deltaproteobacteria bacterium Smac51]
MIDLLDLIVTIIVMVFIIAQYFLLLFKRKDDLFTLRFDLYSRLRKYWLTTSKKNTALEEIITPLAEEAFFLFDEKVYNYVMGLIDDYHHGSDYFPRDEFIEPFLKYLKIHNK